MTENSETQNPTGNVKLPTQTPDCGAGCACHTAGPTSRIRWIVGAVIIVAAAVLVVRAIAKNTNGNPVDKYVTGLASGQTPELSAQVGQEINGLSDLDTVAADTNAAFVFLPDKNSPGKPPLAQMQGAIKTLDAKGIKIGLFTLRTDSPDYAPISAQMPVPGIIVAVKGRGMKAVSGEITETKLIQAFVAASSAGGCGPSGCGPSDPSCK